MVVLKIRKWRKLEGVKVGRSVWCSGSENGLCD